MKVSADRFARPDPRFDAAASRASMLDGILESIPHGVCVFGPDWRLRMVNRAYGEIMQGAPIAIGEDLPTIIRRRAAAGEYGPDDPDAVFDREMTRLASPRQLRRRQRPNGTTIDIRTAPLPDGGHISVVTDVTPLMQAERESRRREAELDVMLSSITQGLTLFDKEHRLVVANRMASELVNLPAAMLAAGTADRDMMLWLHAHGEFGDGPEADARFAMRLATDRSRPDVFRRRTSDGRVLEFRSDPTPDGGYVATLTDVTRAVTAEAELRRAKDAAEAA
ncbi:MAG: PAS-domain containing protein, partial [Alphaproteobacteria bacterium]|nr:PAS-domain containing protein [Alphaproteobacteria bacterium]